MATITLRALTMNDVDKTLRWNNQDDIREFYSGHPFPVNKEMEIIWYQKILTSNYPTTVFGIEAISSKELIGLSLLKDINNINRSAEFSIYIGEKNHRGKGISKEATIETLKFGFFSLGLNRVFLKVLLKNTIATNLYEKIGFHKEGLLRDAVFKNNSFEDELIMAILKIEFENNYHEL